MAKKLFNVLFPTFSLSSRIQPKTERRSLFLNTLKTSLRLVGRDVFGLYFTQLFSKIKFKRGYILFLDFVFLEMKIAGVLSIHTRYQ